MAARLEDALQESIIQLLARYEAMGRLRYFAIPNEGKRSPKTGAQMKRRGLRAGSPDLCVMIVHGPTIFMECKTPKGRIEDSQMEFFVWTNANGGNRAAYIVRSADVAHDILKEHMQARAA